MKVLITGMSGTGKSTIIAALKTRGHRAIDLDLDGWSTWATCEGNPTGAKPGYDWIWNEARLKELLAEDAPGPLFVAGCAPNMGRFKSSFDRIVLLSAPVELLLERVAGRDGNLYGKTPAEAAQIAANTRDVEPALRRLATHEVDASLTLDEVLRAVETATRGGKQTLNRQRAPRTTKPKP